MMKIYNYLLTDPFTWIYYCLFQPAKFEKEFENANLSSRIEALFRSILPIFIISAAISILLLIVLKYFDYGSQLHSIMKTMTELQSVNNSYIIGDVVNKYMHDCL